MKILLPPTANDAEREALLRVYMCQRGKGYLRTVNRGDPDWVLQLGNRDSLGRVFFVVIEHDPD